MPEITAPPLQDERGKLTPEIVRWAQQQHGHTNERAARTIGVSLRVLQRWKAGVNAPTGLSDKHARSYIVGAYKLAKRRADADTITTPPPEGGAPDIHDMA